MLRDMAQQIALALLAAVLVGCGSASGSPGATPSSSSGPTTLGQSQGAAASAAPGPANSQGTPPARTLVVDTDVAPDDLVALSFLVSSPNVTIAAITVSGTGEAHCAGGVDVVLRLLDRLDAPQIPVACGREAPLAGSRAFPAAWRAAADSGSGLGMPATSRKPAGDDAVTLLRAAASAHPGIAILTLGPLTNLADALQAEPALGGKVAAVFVMGGAVHVPGNLVGPDAPAGNSVAEWNIYVDPTAARAVVEAGVNPRLVSLDGTNQVPVTRAFAARIQSAATGKGAKVLADLFAANPFMAGGAYYLWDPLAAELAAGYPVGTFAGVAIDVEQSEGPESGFTRPTTGTSNAGYLSVVDPSTAEDTLLAVLNGR